MTSICSCKAVFENLDDFKKQHPAFANLDPKKMIVDGHLLLYILVQLNIIKKKA